MEFKNRNLFRLTRLVLLTLPKLLFLFAKFRKKRKRILIIKIDEIGDYFLIRNFFEEVKKSPAYLGYEIDLLGNRAWKNIATEYDYSYFDKLYFINPSNAFDSPYKMLKLGWELFNNNYEIVLQPTFTRRLLNDGLAALSAAKNIIGFYGNHDGIFPKYKKRTDLFYTKMFTLPQSINFEFDKNQFFFQNSIDKHIQIDKPFINVNRTANSNPNIILFPGAGNVQRCWPLQNYIEICKLLIANTQYEILLCGGKSEMEEAKKICELLSSNRIKNEVGKTTLSETLQLIADSQIVICNETSALHMAAACNISTVCIMGGGHFNRFAPYPSRIQNKIKYVYTVMPCYYCNWNCIYQIKETETFPCISALSVLHAWQAINELLEEME